MTTCKGHTWRNYTGGINVFGFVTLTLQRYGGDLAVKRAQRNRQGYGVYNPKYKRKDEKLFAVLRGTKSNGTAERV